MDATITWRQMTNGTRAWCLIFKTDAEFDWPTRFDLSKVLIERNWVRIAYSVCFYSASVTKRPIAYLKQNTSAKFRFPSTRMSFSRHLTAFDPSINLIQFIAYVPSICLSIQLCALACVLWLSFFRLLFCRMNMDFWHSLFCTSYENIFRFDFFLYPSL